MLRHLLLGTTCLCAAGPVMADITADDVWANLKAYYTATGASVQGELLRNGNVVTVNAPTLTYRLPFGAGAVTMALPGMTLTEDAGTVGFDYPEVAAVTITADLPEIDLVEMVVEARMTGFVGEATGVPGDITYAYSADSLLVGLGRLSLPPEAAESGFSLSFNATIDGMESSSQIVEGDLITAFAITSLGTMSGGYQFQVEDVVSVSDFTYQPGFSRMSLALPAGGSDILNLTPALKAGLSISADSTTEGNSGTTRTTLYGELVDEQVSNVGLTETQFSVNADGVFVAGTAADISVSVMQPDMLPVPFVMDVAEAEAAYGFPLVASDADQDVHFLLRLVDGRLGPAIWSLIDPEKVMPRDPLQLEVDLTAQVQSDVDLLDFLALEQKFSGPVPPGGLSGLTIRALDLSAVGAAISGEGDFSFDMSDLETFDGLPRPEGGALIRVRGAQALLERLESLGLVSPEEAGGARMGMGMVARTTGDDAFETAIEINAEGHVMLNGQRVF